MPPGCHVCLDNEQISFHYKYNMNHFEMAPFVELFVLNTPYFSDKTCKIGAVSDRADRHNLS